MKKLLLFFIALSGAIINGNAQSSNSWTQKNDFGGIEREHAVGFSIGTNGYIGTGYDINGIYKNDFWEFNPNNNTWTQKADFGGTARFGAVGFNIGTKGYIGTGFDGSYRDDFWEYNPGSNTWTQKADFGGGIRYEPVGFSIGTKGYIGTGSSSGLHDDFWEYNPASNSWTQQNNFPGAARAGAVGFSIGNKGYIGTGYDGNNNLKDFYEWNQATNTWVQKANFKGPARWHAAGFSIGTKGYIGTGDTGVSTTSVRVKDFWMYNPTSDVWSQKADFGGTARWLNVGFSIGSKGYIGTGNDGSVVKDFWEYTPDNTLGINDVNDNNETRIYPTIGDGNFTLTYNLRTSKGTLNLVDINGKLVYNHSISSYEGVEKINASELKSDIYYWELVSANGVLSKGKIIIMK